MVNLIFETLLSIGSIIKQAIFVKNVLSALKKSGGKLLTFRWMVNNISICSDLCLVVFKNFATFPISSVMILRLSDLEGSVTYLEASFNNKAYRGIR